MLRYAGIDLNSVDNYGLTPLSQAAYGVFDEAGPYWFPVSKIDYGQYQAIKNREAVVKLHDA